jgi:hypothetical protein
MKENDRPVSKNGGPMTLDVNWPSLAQESMRLSRDDAGEKAREF